MMTLKMLGRSQIRTEGHPNFTAVKPHNCVQGERLTVEICPQSRSIRFSNAQATALSVFSAVRVLLTEYAALCQDAQNASP